MIFKSSYIITENDAFLRCGPAIGRRQLVALGLAAIASVAAGLAVFSVLSSALPASNKVTWKLQPAKVAHTAPAKPLIVMTTARIVPTIATQTAEDSKSLPRS